MNIDIRVQETERVTSIQFANNDRNLDAYVIKLDGEDTSITDGDVGVYIRNAENAKHLIKALEKAIELKTWG